MKQLLLIFHSQSRRSEALALNCYSGAVAAEEVAVRLLRAVDADADDLLQADAVVFFTPENFAAIAGGMKDFLDRVFYPMERAEKRALPYALVISAGNAGSSTVQQFERIMGGIAAKPIQAAQIIHGKPGTQELAAMQEMGEALAVGLQMGVF